ncbi:hypothetical protein [Enterobacter chuandaensis]|uniref:hypothetical protein n=1 Tax=Enterobacter chuandaensis TaxID=2497875 RepID=UPI0020C6C197|nr:hypothetical protein [Enterobacter chuandaensis]
MAAALHHGRWAAIFSATRSEGFFFMANQYKEDAAGGADLTAQRIANMNHIVVNNYTNAGLGILFTVVVLQHYLLRHQNTDESA